MLVDEFPLLGMIEDLVEQRRALLLWHVEDADRHQPIDVDRLLAGVLVGAEHRMHAFSENLGAFAVAALGRAVIVVVQRLAAFEPLADRRIERVIGGIAAGKQGVSAGRGNLDRIEQSPLARHLDVDHVVMEHHLAVGQRADRLAVLADVGDQHDAGQQARIALGEILGRPAERADLAKKARCPHQIFLRQILLGKDDDEMIEPGLVDCPNGLRVGLLAQIDAAQLRADMLGQGNDLQPALCHQVHGASSGAWRRHLFLVGMR